MNGRRRFLLGTVLSIQNSSFIYPACQNCCSRLIRTSCRYECHKCGSTSTDASYRYKLCVKVSEEQRLHVITIFGKCLEQVFGGSADSLHSQLQVRDVEHDRAQELLLQAAEHCLIGKSFIFAVKIPENFDRYNSFSYSNLHRNIVACQIILLHEDPMSCSILSYFNRLVASVLSNNSIHTDVSANTTTRDLSDVGFSESSSSLPQSWNHYADYWQQSFGLVSSPSSNTCRKSECRGAEQVPYPLTPMSQNTAVCTDLVIHSSSVESIGTPRVKCSSAKHTNTNTHSPPGSSYFNSFSSKSEMPLGQESYLQNVCKSGSRRSQSCSARTTQLPPQKAEIHQAKEEIWEDFPFSESLSEFIAKIEDDQRERPTESKAATSIERTTCSLNLPGAKPTQNCTIVKVASPCNFDKCYSSVHNLNHTCEISGRDDTGLTFPSVDSGNFWESLETGSPFDDLTQVWLRQSPTKVISNAKYINGGLDLCSSIEDGTLSDNDDEPKFVDVERPKCFMAGDLYNASADLFDASSNNPEDGETSQSLHIVSQGRLVASVTDSLRTDVLPYRHRRSSINVRSLSDNYKTWSKLRVEDFVPYLQSTPVLRRLSGTGRLTGDAWCSNMASGSKSSIISIRTKSSRTFKHVLLKNTMQRKSTIFYGLSENDSLWSPTMSSFSEESMVLMPKKRWTMSAQKPWQRGTALENKENCDNQPCHCKGPNSALTCTVQRTDFSNARREESLKYCVDTLDNMENLSPVNRSMQEGEDRLCSAEQLLPSDWSPELFSGKSDISQPSDSLQRRLF
ncbi:DNA damage-induced apoptosis suppressor protein [Dendropsophus ebraccatus]|uniref:DNA damage-induced apoptosis suppressor protein n=1 Tax=Dendropsophus ebraccatus TaxID=150705 RepID=UPI0038315273